MPHWKLSARVDCDAEDDVEVVSTASSQQLGSGQEKLLPVISTSCTEHSHDPIKPVSALFARSLHIQLLEEGFPRSMNSEKSNLQQLHLLG